MTRITIQFQMITRSSADADKPTRRI